MSDRASHSRSDSPLIRQRSYLERFTPGINLEKTPVFYNILTVLIILAVSVAVWGAYVILHPFLKPLFWALLCGSFLHPFKYQLCEKMKTKLTAINTPDVLPVIVNIACFPVIGIITFSEKMWSLINAYLFHLLAICTLISIFLFTPEVLVEAFWTVCNTGFTSFVLSFGILSHILTVFTLLVSTVLIVYYLPVVGDEILTLLSLLCWLSILCFVASLLGFMKLPFFVFALVFVICAIIFVNGSENDTQRTPHQDEPKKNEPSKKKVETPKSRANEDGNEQSDSKQSANTYIYWVAASCFCMMMFKLPWTPWVLMLVVFTILVRRICALVGIESAVRNKVAVLSEKTAEWYTTEEARILIPVVVIKTYKLAQRMKQTILSWLLEKTDSISTACVVLGLIFFATVAFVFITTQIYMEGVYLVKVTSTVLNETMLHNPDLIHILPKDWREELDSAINNAYTYGRSALAKAIKGMMSNVNDQKAKELEHIILELWDRIYQAWFVAPYADTGHGPKVTSEAVYQVWNKFTDPGIGWSALVAFVQENMAVLMAGIMSLWEFIKNNIGLAVYFLGTILSVIVFSGFAILSFIVDVIVFLTALFYLLSSSGKYYKPVEFIKEVSPSYGTKLAFAIERSVAEVFMVSFKLALFYGMYTWLLHNLFQMKIVYVPTVCAAVFAAVPIVSTYWVCLPAVLDLWLIRGNLFSAIVLFVLQFAPTNFIDSAIYEDIHGGHPLLTGLSLAGGVVTFGVQGAIIGPLILCCMLVIVRFCTATFKEPTKGEKKN